MVRYMCTHCYTKCAHGNPKNYAKAKNFQASVRAHTQAKCARTHYTCVYTHLKHTKTAYTHYMWLCMETPAAHCTHCTHCTQQNRTEQNRTAQHTSTVQHNTTKHDKTQHSTPAQNTSTAQHKAMQRTHKIMD